MTPQEARIWLGILATGSIALEAVHARRWSDAPNLRPLADRLGRVAGVDTSDGPVATLFDLMASVDRELEDAGQ